MFGQRGMLFFLLWIVVGLGGCSSHKVMRPEHMDKTIVNTLPDAYALQISNPLKRYPNDILQVEIVITNPTDRKYDDVVYRFRWYDRRKREIGNDLSIWKPLFIDPMDERKVVAVAPSPQAENFRFYIRAGGDFLVKRIDLGAMADIETVYGADDLNQITEKMVGAMLKHKLFDGSITIAVDEVENKTSEHIDTEAITDSIMTAIIQSGRASFVDPKMRTKIAKELAYQQNSGYVKKTEAKRKGQQIAPDYILSGRISSVHQQQKNIEDLYYQIVLELHNVEKGTIDWIGKKPIRKHNTLK